MTTQEKMDKIVFLTLEVFNECNNEAFFELRDNFDELVKAKEKKMLIENKKIFKIGDLVLIGKETEEYEITAIRRTRCSITKIKTGKKYWCNISFINYKKDISGIFQTINSFAI